MVLDLYARAKGIVAKGLEGHRDSLSTLDLECEKWAKDKTIGEKTRTGTDFTCTLKITILPVPRDISTKIIL